MARLFPVAQLPRRWRRLALTGVSVLGAGWITLVGWFLVSSSRTLSRDHYTLAGVSDRVGSLVTSFAQNLARLSYDFPFIVRGVQETPPVCIVYLDEHSASVLGQQGGVWDRRIHTQLVHRLTREGAKLVFFDIVFAEPSAEPAVDEEFAAAMRENGKVYLGAALELDAGLNASQERTVPPTPVLRRAAAGWGLLAFRPLDADYGVRQIYEGLETVPSATWRAARWLGAPLAEKPEPDLVRWMNYYGPSGTFPSVSYDRALAPDGLPPGFFRDRLVFIGGRSTLDVLMLGKDDFRNPFGLIGAEFSKGVEVHLTALLNLANAEWLRRAEARWEYGLVVLIGLLLGGGLPWCRPHLAAVVTLAVMVIVASFACTVFIRDKAWLNWVVPAFVQPSLALGFAVGARYFVEERRRQTLRRAFAHYLSPEMADRIADADFQLAPGGTVVEATVMFTDLEDFTALAERLDNPSAVSEVLTAYFSQTTQHILENDGTIIKYAGDAVQAVWGAPLPDPDQARKAVVAAWHLHRSSLTEVAGYSLKTKIGLHCGPAMAGNLGSAERFDYAVIGDTVNFASRLEGLNKYLGTEILISDELCRKVKDLVRTRCVGEFRVAGKREARVVHEVLGLTGTGAPEPWLTVFDRGLDAFRRGDFGEAKTLMIEVSDLRRSVDGPAAFYLCEIARWEETLLPAEWQGIIELESK